MKGTAAAAVTAGVGCVGWALGVEPHLLEIVARDMPIARLPRALNGKRLVQVSDVHVGTEVSDAYLAESFARVRALAPDIVVCTGDFISYRHDRAEEGFRQLREVLGGFPRGRLATLGILGNHDYGRDWQEPHVAARVAEEAANAGIRILRNEAHVVEGLDVVGVGDLWAGQCMPAPALAARTSDAAIALVHNPDAVDRAEWREYRGWILAGHTHGGQCKPPFLPPPLLPVRNRRYTAGEIGAAPGRTLYINRGVGHLIRARFNVRPEITLFTLRPA